MVDAVTGERTVVELPTDSEPTEDERIAALEADLAAALALLEAS